VKLATVDSVLKRVSINSTLSGAISSAEAGLEAATVLLSNLLDTPLNRQEVHDYFSPAPSAVGYPANLYLTRMFVSSAQAVSVGYGTYSGDTVADVYTALDPGLFSVDHETGKVAVSKIPSSGKMSLKVSYFAGFTDETDTNIPDWLREAAITSAVYVMHTQVAAHGKQDILDISPEYRRMVYSMVQQHLRPRMNCMFSETSIVVP